MKNDNHIDDDHILNKRTNEKTALMNDFKGAVEKETMIKLAFQKCDEGFWISKDWLKKWKEYLQSEDENSNIVFLSENMTELITCPHSSLSIDTSDRKLVPPKVILILNIKQLI